MALSINGEIDSFAKSLKGKTGNMTSTIEKLVSSLGTLDQANNNAISMIGSSYDSQNKQSILNRLEKIATVSKDISTSVSGDLSPIIQKVDKVIELVDELHKLSDLHDSATTKLNAARNAEPRDYSAIASAQNEQRKITDDFNKAENEAVKLYNEVKKADIGADFAIKYNQSTFMDHLDSVEWGTCELRTYKTSSGKTIEYYFYTPKYADFDGEVPLGVYMHGGSPQGTSHAGFGMSGLTKYVLDQSLDPPPPCYLIMPYIRNFEGDNIEYDIKEVIEHEMANAQNEIDESRVFVTGHSYGGIKASAMMNLFPQMFSCEVSMSGTVEATESYRNKDALLINGSGERDPGRISDQWGRQVTDHINNLGGRAFHITFPTNHRGTRDQLWSWKIQTPDGEYANPLYWAVEKENYDSKKA